MSLRNPSSWDSWYSNRLDQTDWQAKKFIELGVDMPVKDLSKVYNSYPVEVVCINPETVKVNDKVWSTKYGEGKVKSMAPEYYERRYMKVDFKASSKPIVMDVQYDLLGYEAIPGEGYESEMTLFCSLLLFRKSRVKIKGRMLRFEVAC